MIIKQMLAISVLALGVAFAGVGAKYVLNMGVIPQSLNFSGKTVFDSLTPGYCVKKGFGNISLRKPDNYVEKTDEFNVFEDESKSLAEGCLVVNWRKQKLNEEEKAWKGFLRWEWTLVKNDEAVILSSGLRSSLTQNKTLDLSTKILALKKTDDKWKLRFYLEKELLGISASDYSVKVPYGFASEEFSNGKVINEKRNWGFAPFFTEACKLNDYQNKCNFSLDVSAETFNTAYEWREDSLDAQVSDDLSFRSVHQNFDSWWAQVAGGKLSLNQIIYKKGTWDKLF